MDDISLERNESPLITNKVTARELVVNTHLTSGLLIPIPNAIVAQMTLIVPVDH